LEVVEKDLLNNNEAYLARIKRMAAAKNSIKVKVITFLTYQNRKVIDWVNVKKQPYWRLAYEEQQAYAKYQQFLKKIDKIEDLQSIQKKINSITHLIPQIGTTLDYLEALSAKKEEVPA
jgi:spore coat polysaccharide biosynthesis protein SpsF (cytidylyltransferase family)